MACGSILMCVAAGLKGYGLIVGGIMCVVLLALIVGLHYGSPGHSAPLRHAIGRRRGSSPLGLGAIVEPTGSQAGHISIPGG
jgi:hypothetical protein